MDWDANHDWPIAARDGNRVLPICEKLMERPGVALKLVPSDAREFEYSSPYRLAMAVQEKGRTKMNLRISVDRDNGANVAWVKLLGRR